MIGIDTPEIGWRAKCPEEQQKGIAARDFLRGLILFENVTITGLKHDKYGGRFNAITTLPDGQTIAQTMIHNGHARAYDGKGKRQGWC